MRDMREEIAGKVEDHIKRHLPSALDGDAEVTEVRTAGHHVRAHAVAEMRTSCGEFRLFLKALKPERKEAELFAYDRLLPTAICSSPKVMARFPDWEWPTVWLALEYLEGRWASTEPTDRSRTISAIADLHASGFLAPDLGHVEDAPRTRLDEFSSMYDKVEGEREYLDLDSSLLALLKDASYRLPEAPSTWTRTDNDRSNFLVADKKVWMIDWEFLRWASPALDLGNVLAHVDMEFHRGCAETYRTQLSSHGVEVEVEKVGEWIRMGLCHDALNTFCYAVDRKREGRFGPNDDWFSTWGMPRVNRLREIRDGQHEMDQTDSNGGSAKATGGSPG